MFGSRSRFGKFGFAIHTQGNEGGRYLGALGKRALEVRTLPTEWQGLGTGSQPMSGGVISDGLLRMRCELAGYQAVTEDSMPKRGYSLWKSLPDFRSLH